MQVSVESVSKLERKLTVKFPADEYETKVRQRITELGRSVRLKGFRPGKVPARVIEQRFGAQVRGEALSDLINSTFREAVQQQKLQPVANPAIDTDGKPADGEIAYTATFEVMPELPTVEVPLLKIDRPKSEVGEADVDKMIETLRLQRRVFEKVGRAAADGDMVIVDYHAEADGFRHPAEGRERAATIIGGKTALAVFDAELTGKSAGDELAFDAEFPATFPIPQLAAKHAKVDLKVGEVQEPHVPEVDEAFIHNFGIADGKAETFRQEVRSNLERELGNALRARLRNEVGAKLAQTYADIEVPKALQNAEAESLVRAAMGNANLPADKPIPKEALDAARPLAHQRVIAGLLLRQVAQSNNLTVDNRKVNDRIVQIASTYEEPEQVVELYRTNPQMMEGIRTAVLEDQVSEWVAEHADTTDVALSFDEVMHPQQPVA